MLAANAKARSSIVPKAAPKPAPEPQLVLLFDSEPSPLAPPPPSPSRHPWPWLLQRVFAVDILTCPRCQGTMRLVEIATEHEAIERILASDPDAAAAGSRAPPARGPGRSPAPGQLAFRFD